MDPAKIFEAGMLICFGFSWPVAIFKTLRVRKVHGKSIGFLLLICLGYLSGITMKFMRADGGWPDWVTALYALNATMVAVEIALYFRYRQPPEVPALDLELEPPGAELTESAPGSDRL